MSDNKHQFRYAFLITTIGVALVAVTAIYGVVRTVLLMAAFASRRGFGAGRQLRVMNPFGLGNALTILSVIIAVLGLVWLGLSLRKQHERSAKTSR
jgi:Na+-transporting NADH:ubiquinone oxidoreductase subunit NqrB